MLCVVGPRHSAVLAIALAAFKLRHDANLSHNGLLLAMWRLCPAAFGHNAYSVHGFRGLRAAALGSGRHCRGGVLTGDTCGDKQRAWKKSSGFRDTTRFRFSAREFGVAWLPMTSDVPVTHAVTVGELTFQVQTAGSASRPLVLLLHGFPQTSHTYRAVLPALARAGYYAVAPDQRGYSPGARPVGVAHYATQLLMQDALDIAEALGHRCFHLVGHDWGGQLSWLIAASEPARLRSLSVLSRPHPQAFAAALQRDAAQAERSRHHRAFDDPQTAQRLLEDDARRLKRSLCEQGVAESDVTAYLKPLREPGALDATLNWYRAARTASRSAQAPATASITVPTLYVWGDADATVGRAAAESTGEWVTAAYRFEILAGAGHFLTDQQPERVTQLLLEHIERCS